MTEKTIELKFIDLKKEHITFSVLSNGLGLVSDKFHIEFICYPNKILFKIYVEKELCNTYETNKKFDMLFDILSKEYKDVCISNEREYFIINGGLK